MIRARTNSGEQVERPADRIRGGALAASTVQTIFLFWGVGGPVSISTPNRSITRAIGAICRPAPSLPTTIHGDGRARTWTRGRAPNHAADRRPWSGPPLSKNFVCNTCEAGLFSGLLPELRRRPGHVRTLSRRYGRGERLFDGRPVLAGKYAVQCPVAAAWPCSK